MNPNLEAGWMISIFLNLERVTNKRAVDDTHERRQPHTRRF